MQASSDALMTAMGDLLEIVKDLGPILVGIDMRASDVEDLRAAIPVSEDQSGGWRGVPIKPSTDVPYGLARARYSDGSSTWIELVDGALALQGVTDEVTS